MTIFSWNVNGIKAISNKKALLWVDTFKPTILCLQEIRTQEKDIPNTFNKVYKNIAINCGNVKGMSGTLTYTDLNLESESFTEEVDIKSEGRIIEHHHKNIVIFNVYIPNGKSSEKRLKYKINFLNKFYRYSERLRKEGKSIIICGDFNTAHKNIDLKKTKIHSKSGFSDTERLCLDKFLKKNYLDTYRFIHGEKKEAYTWWSYRSNGRLKNEGWRIDYIFISKDLKNNLKNAFILDEVIGSDHCPIGIELVI
ncbi:exodeoxyribonuclease III [Arcobacter sp. F2176]|nr:exodeoxyribonuclease III [Arcobacter sp. F2176]